MFDYHTTLLKLIWPRGRFYGRISRENLPLKSSRGLRDTYSIYYLLQQSHFVGSIMFSPAGGFFEKFTKNHLTSPKPTTALSTRKKLYSFLVALSMRSMLAASALPSSAFYCLVSLPCSLRSKRIVLAAYRMLRKLPSSWISSRIRSLQYILSRSVLYEERLFRMTNHIIKFDWLLVSKCPASDSLKGGRLDRGCNMPNGWYR